MAAVGLWEEVRTVLQKDVETSKHSARKTPKWHQSWGSFSGSLPHWDFLDGSCIGLEQLWPLLPFPLGRGVLGGGSHREMRVMAEPSIQYLRSDCRSTDEALPLPRSEELSAHSHWETPLARSDSSQKKSWVPGAI